jgi:ubiquinol-cytochrome c reductase cytochrome b subunit
MSEIPTKTPASGSSSFRQWFEQRTGLDSILRVMLDEPIPGGARWAYIFGSGLLFLFLSQILTGITLALYYVPAVNDAHVTVAYIVKVVSGGSFLRSLHSYGASATIVVLLLHIIQTFFYGSYKGRRELVWIAGCALFALMLGMAFTGYLLPWDQKAYFATAVGTNVMNEVPVVGNALTRLLRGGNQMGTITLSRFFVLHVFVLPGLIAALVVIHVYLFRKAGPAGPVSEDPVHPRLPTEMFYPRQFARDFVFVIVLIGALGGLSYLFPVRLGPEANPADAAFLPRPEWYFLPFFQWLKLWPGQSALIGVVILPAVVTALFVGLPFIDRGLHRHPLRRPLAIGTFCLVLAGMIGLGVLSRTQDRRDPAIAAQMARQEQALQAFMGTPFSPQMTPADSGSAAPSDPVAKGKERFAVNKCFDCHGHNGEGTVDGPDLTKIKLTPEQTAAFLQKPSSDARLAGMPDIPATSADFQPLLAYVLSLKRPAP